MRFSKPIDGTDNPQSGPANADPWRFYPYSLLGSNGFRTNISDVWGGIAIYASKEAAEAVINNPNAHLPFLDEVEKAWHALAVPYTLRGGVNWRGEFQELAP